MIYAFPDEWMPKKAKEIVSPYVYPIFDQHWAMFAPCPLIEGNIKIEIMDKDGVVQTLRPFEDALHTHRIFRVTHHGDVSIQASNLIHWVAADNLDYSDGSLSNRAVEKNDLVNTLSYTLLKRMVYGYAQNLNIKLDRADVNCDLLNVKTDEKHTIEYPQMKWNQ